MRILFWILLKMRLPEGHIVEAKLAKGRVKVHFQPGRFGCERREDIRIIRPRADELAVVAARLLTRSIQSQIECRMIEYRRFRIRHRQDGCHTTGQGGLGGSVPVLLVGLSGLAYVDVRVDQAGKSYHGMGFQVSNIRFQVESQEDIGQDHQE